MLSLPPRVRLFAATEPVDKPWALLDSVGDACWASKVRGALGSIDPDEILSWYGGSGSFNDLMIATINGHHVTRGQESVTNTRLAELRSQVDELATRANR